MAMQLNLQPDRKVNNLQIIFDVNFLDLNHNSQIGTFREALINGITRLEADPTCAASANIYLGNPGDTDYVDKPVNAIYLGTDVHPGGYTTYWLNVSHDGKIMVSSTYGDSIVSTCGFWIRGHHIADLKADDERKARAEKILQWFKFTPNIPWCMNSILRNDYATAKPGEQIYLGGDTWITKLPDGIFEFQQGVGNEAFRTPAKQLFNEKTMKKIEEIFA